MAPNKASGTPKEGWGTTGELALFVLDVASLEKGELKVVQQATITGGNPKSTITFRQYYTPDGKYILQSANDMFYVIDAKTLAALDLTPLAPWLEPDEREALRAAIGAVRVLLSSSTTLLLTPCCVR